MSDIPKSHKLGEVEIADQHLMVRFHRDDYKHINEMYLDPIITLNDVIDSTLDEIYSIKREIDRMSHWDQNNKQMMWTYTHGNRASAEKTWLDFQKFEQHLDATVEMRKNRMDEFHNNLIRKWNDQTVADSKFEPDDIAKADDLVPLVGVAQIAKQVTRETFRTWDWFGLGRSDIPAEFDDEFLKDEIGRYFIKTHGALSSIGEVIRLLVVSPDDMGTEDIVEVCVSNKKSGGDILFRTVLDKKVHHEAGEHFLATSANIYLVSRR